MTSCNMWGKTKGGQPYKKGKKSSGISGNGVPTNPTGDIHLKGKGFDWLKKKVINEYRGTINKRTGKKFTEEELEEVGSGTAARVYHFQQAKKH